MGLLNIYCSNVALSWQLLILNILHNWYNKSQLTEVLSRVSPYIISAIYGSGAVPHRLWCHLRMWNVNLIHPHYLPKLIGGAPRTYQSKTLSKKNVTIGPPTTSSRFQLRSFPLPATPPPRPTSEERWRVPGAELQKKKKRRIIAFVLEPLAVNCFGCIMKFASFFSDSDAHRLYSGRLAFCSFVFFSFPHLNSEAVLKVNPPNHRRLKFSNKVMITWVY